jgi:small subunit ribosomal protein S16
MGAKKRPFYRLVVADSRSPRDGKFIEEIGYYDPLPNPATVRIDVDKVHEWMRKGARPSDVARKLLEREGILQRSAQSRRIVAPASPPVAEAPAAAETPEVEAAVEEERAAESEAEAETQEEQS